MEIFGCLPVMMNNSSKLSTDSTLLTADSPPTMFKDVSTIKGLTCDTPHPVVYFWYVINGMITTRDAMWDGMSLQDKIRLFGYYEHWGISMTSPVVKQWLVDTTADLRNSAPTTKSTEPPRFINETSRKAILPTILMMMEIFPIETQELSYALDRITCMTERTGGRLLTAKRFHGEEPIPPNALWVIPGFLRNGDYVSMQKCFRTKRVEGIVSDVVLYTSAMIGKDGDVYSRLVSFKAGGIQVSMDGSGVHEYLRGPYFFRATT
jgi:hypothetical protein